MFDFDEDNVTFKISTARTNRLWCSDCKKRIRKGDRVIFVLENHYRGVHMQDCYCSKCGYEIEESILDGRAFEDAIGLGQD